MYRDMNGTGEHYVKWNVRLNKATITCSLVQKLKNWSQRSQSWIVVTRTWKRWGEDGEREWEKEREIVNEYRGTVG